MGRLRDYTPTQHVEHFEKELASYSSAMSEMSSYKRTIVHAGQTVQVVFQVRFGRDISNLFDPLKSRSDLNEGQKNALRDAYFDQLCFKEMGDSGILNESQDLHANTFSRHSNI